MTENVKNAVFLYGSSLTISDGKTFPCDGVRSGSFFDQKKFSVQVFLNYSYTQEKGSKIEGKA